MGRKVQEKWRKGQTGWEGYGYDVYYGVDGVEDCSFRGLGSDKAFSEALGRFSR